MIFPIPYTFFGAVWKLKYDSLRNCFVNLHMRPHFPRKPFCPKSTIKICPNVNICQLLLPINRKVNLFRFQKFNEEISLLGAICSNKERIRLTSYLIFSFNALHGFQNRFPLLQCHDFIDKSSTFFLKPFLNAFIIVIFYSLPIFSFIL